MLRNTPNTEALIVEYGFLDNASDANKLKNNYKKYAEAVVKAVTEYAGYKYVPLAGSDYYVINIIFIIIFNYIIITITKFWNTIIPNNSHLSSANLQQFEQICKFFKII